MDGRTLDLIKAQVEEVQSQYPDFELVLLESGEPEMTGTLAFDIEHEGHKVGGEFAVRVRFPADYDKTYPFVWESGGQIPADFGHFMQAGNLCLGAPVELQEKFAAHRNLLRFLNEQVVPYLFSFVHLRDHGTMPFGELSHGYRGLLFYYCERFETHIVPTLKLLKSLADDFRPPEGRCACGREARFRECHGPQLAGLRAHHLPEQFEAELRGMLKFLQTPEMVDFLAGRKIVIPTRAVTPKRLLRNLDRRSSR